MEMDFPLISCCLQGLFEWFNGEIDNSGGREFSKGQFPFAELGSMTTAQEMSSRYPQMYATENKIWLQETSERIQIAHHK